MTNLFVELLSNLPGNCHIFVTDELFSRNASLIIATCALESIISNWPLQSCPTISRIASGSGQLIRNTTACTHPNS